VIFWNVNGCSETDFLDSNVFHAITHFDVICFTETQHTSSEQFEHLTQQYDLFHMPAPSPQKRGFGICTFVKKALGPFTTLHAFEVTEGHQVLAVRILKTAFNLDKDVVYVNCYVPHSESPQLKHITLQERFYFLSALCQDINGSDSYIVLGGDFNAHCRGLGHHGDNNAGAFLRTVAEDNDLLFITGSDFEDGDTVVHTFHHCNAYGDCRGSSRPDHILCSTQLTSFIQNSSVDSHMVDSDHLPVDVTFLFTTVANVAPPALHPPFPRLRWKGREREYVQAIRQMIQAGQFDKAMQPLQVDDVNTAVEDFVFCIVQAAVDSGHDVRAQGNNNSASKSSSSHKPWFDRECRLARKTYRRSYGESFDSRIHARNIYNSFIRRKQRAWQKKAVQQLIDDIHRNPRSFWSHFSNHKNISAAHIEVPSCVQYFKALLFRDDERCTFVATGSSSDEPNHWLNRNFTDDEVAVVVNNLHNHKACGSDIVSAEFYKYAVSRDERGYVVDNILAPYLRTLFQWIFDRSTVPDKWGEALLTLIFKAGEHSDWGNYRPIAVIQAICKIYGILLYNRLNIWAEHKNLRRPSQAGFRPRYGTEMHSFTLLELIQQYKEKNKPLFVCFVDLSKAYDSVIRQKIWDRLFHLGFRGKILHSLVSYYQNVSARLKFQEGVSDSFECNMGVKQGCPLSPFLFGVFIEILHDAVQATTPHLGAKLEFVLPAIAIALLMYADDISLLEEEPRGLQELLDILAQFCSDNDMHANLDKTRSMVFNREHAKRSQLNFVFKLQGVAIQKANEYKYLGLLMAPKRTVPTAMQNVVVRARKATGVVYQKFRKLEINSNVFLKHRLFNAVVLPNVTFGCQVWGPWFLKHDIVKDAFDSGIERVRLGFYKLLLQLKSSVSSWCVYREMGIYPLQVFVARQCIRFLNKLMLQFNNTSWARHAMINAWNRHTQHDGGGMFNWFSVLSRFLQSCGIEPKEAIEGVPIYDEQYVVERLRGICHGAFLSQDAPSKMMTYKQLCGLDFPGVDGTEEWKVAPYLKLPLPAGKLGILARFRLRSHYLEIEVGAWAKVPIEHRFCSHCQHLSTNPPIGDEYHLLFDCPAFEAGRDNLMLRVLAPDSIGSVFRIWDINKEWPKYMKSLILYLETTGKMFQPGTIES
jgi:exonuclease III